MECIICWEDGRSLPSLCDCSTASLFCTSWLTTMKLLSGDRVWGVVCGGVECGKCGGGVWDVKCGVCGMWSVGCRV